MSLVASTYISVKAAGPGGKLVGMSWGSRLGLATEGWGCGGRYG